MIKKVYLLTQKIRLKSNLNVGLVLVLLLLIGIYCSKLFYKSIIYFVAILIHYTFTLSWVHKVTVGTLTFPPVVAHLVTQLDGEITQSSDQVRMRLILQLIKDIQ